MDWARRLGLEAVELHPSLPSTNDRARSWIREGVEPPALVWAEEQTAGRGRGGRAWVSGRDAGVWVSVIIEAGSPEVDRLVPLRTGLSLAERLTRLPGGPGTVLLKWPNDLWSDQGKIGGILCETVRDRIVVGIGINRVPPRIDAPYPVAGIGEAVDAPRVVAAVVEAVMDARAHLSGRLYPREREAWLRRDLLAGRRVAVDEGPEGTARGIDAEGHLVLATADGGHRTVTAGSVRPSDGDTWKPGS